MSIAVTVAIVLVAAAAFSAMVMWLLWRAIGNAIDWLILTFGNDRAAEEIRERLGWEDE